MANFKCPITFEDAVVFDAACTFSSTPAEIVLTNLTGLAIGADGAGTVAPTLGMKKTAGSYADINFEAADDLRGRVRLDANEAMVFEVFDAASASTGTITMSNAAGAVALSGALAVTGATTLAAAACTTLAASGAVTCATTLGVTGASTLAAVACTTLAPSGTLAAAGAVTVGTTLAVTGASTLAAVACTTLAPSGTLAAAGAVTVGTTLAVTGTSTMAAINASGTVAAAGAMTVGTTLAVTGTTTAAAINASGTIAAAGAVTVGTTLAVTGATTLAAASSTSLTASTSLITTGATQVGLEYSLEIPIASLVGTGVYGAPVPFPGTIRKVYVRINDALTTADAVLTGKIASTAITNGVVTCTQAASAAGSVFNATPSAANTVAAGDNLNFTVSGTQDAAVGATLVCIIRRSA